MGIEQVRLREIAAVDSTKQTAPVAQEEVTSVDFSKARAIGAYETNSKSNSFLKEYLYARAQGKGVKIPEGMAINISSPKEYSNEFKELLKSVRVDIYGARVADMFKLLTQDIGAVEKRVAQMKISDEEKAKILTLKAMLDDYYRVEANYNGKTYNLLHTNEQEQAELQEISPEFMKFIKAEQAELVKHTADFAKDEIERVELGEAGATSKGIAYALVPALLANGAAEVYKSRAAKKAMKLNPKAFLAEQRELYKAGTPLKLKNLKKYLNPFKELKGSSKARLYGILGLTFSSCWDDLAGCVKDFFQDKDNFGAGTATAIAIPSAALGVASSFYIAPVIGDMIDFNRAKKHLAKAGELPKASGMKNILKKGGKGAALALGATALFGAGKFLAQSVMGCVTTSSSSGSSWGSMAGTKLVMGLNGDELVEKNIIDEKDNTSTATNENMMAYEAYKGKWEGISKSDPALGVLFGGTGLLTHHNPFVQATAFALQGCSETLTACAYQIGGDDYRGREIQNKKEALVAAAQQ